MIFASVVRTNSKNVNHWMDIYIYIRIYIYICLHSLMTTVPILP